MPIKLPGLSDRITNCGRTGTGKTHGAIYVLSCYPLNVFPFVLVDCKREEKFDDIPNVMEVGFDFRPGPKDAGLFRLRVTPYDLNGTSKEMSRLDKFLTGIWERGHCGLFIDEAYIIGNSDALNLCYTQGRSLEIPMISNTQRPVWCSKFAFSEAGFIQVYDLSMADDIDTVESYIPPLYWDEEPPLKKFQSFYYEVGEKKLVRLNPVPTMEELIKVFDEKLPKRRVWV